MTTPITLSVPTHIIRALTKVQAKKDRRTYLLGIHFDVQDPFDPSGCTLNLVATDGSRMAVQPVSLDPETYAALGVIDQIRDGRLTIDFSGVTLPAKADVTYMTLFVGEQQVQDVTKTYVTHVEIRTNGNKALIPVEDRGAFPCWRRVDAPMPDMAWPVAEIAFDPGLLAPFGSPVKFWFGPQGANGPITVRAHHYPDMRITIQPHRWTR